MIQKDENYLSMVTATLKVLDANKTLWSSNVPVTNSINDIKEDVAAIAAAQKGGATISTGYTTDKEAAGDAAIVQAVKLAGLAQAYASDQKNYTLNDQLKLSFTTLDRLADNVLSPVLSKIHDTIAALGNLVEPYGVTGNELTILKSAIDDFDAIKSNPRVIIAERKGHNASIPALLREIRAAFYKLDRLVKIWQNSHSKFVTDYQNARIVIDLGTRHNKATEGDEA